MSPAQPCVGGVAEEASPQQTTITIISIIVIIIIVIVNIIIIVVSVIIIINKISPVLKRPPRPLPQYNLWDPHPLIGLFLRRPVFHLGFN